LECGDESPHSKTSLPMTVTRDGCHESERKLRAILETNLRTVSAVVMEGRAEANFTDELRRRFGPCCEKHHFRLRLWKLTN